MREKIDELRSLLDCNDRRVVSIVGLSGLIDVTTSGIYKEYADSGDRAYIFLGPKGKLNATRTVKKEDGTIVYTFEIKPE